LHCVRASIPNLVMAGPLSRPSMNTVSTNVAGDASIAVTTINDNKRETLYISVENPPLRRPRRSFRGAVFMGGRDNGPAMTNV